MKFAGIRRETAPFVLTPEFAYVITDGKEKPEKCKNFKKFVEYTTTAYNILRHNTNIFFSLFMLMLSTGIPELSTLEDLDYLKESFFIGFSDEEASKYMEGLVFESLKTKTTQLNNFFHIIAHQKENWDSLVDIFFYWKENKLLNKKSKKKEYLKKKKYIYLIFFLIYFFSIFFF